MSEKQVSKPVSPELLKEFKLGKDIDMGQIADIFVSQYEENIIRQREDAQSRIKHLRSELEAPNKKLNADGETRSHPLVTRHPETGKKILFVNPAYTSGIKGMRPAEAQPLLDYLYGIATQPAFTCRMRWSQGTLAIWDNRSTQHYAVMDYPPCHRKMERAGIIGDKPY